MNMIVSLALTSSLVQSPNNVGYKLLAKGLLSSRNFLGFDIEALLLLFDN